MTLPDIKNYYLHEIGIERWSLRDKPDDLEKLKATVRACQACVLHQNRKQTVFGVGSITADVMFVGEAPGEQEDKQGEPFVGRAGKLLDAMLHSVGFTRKEIYIANILKCRPPQNRDPLPEEISQCTLFLEQQIALIRPKILVALGRIAAHYLLKKNLPLTKLRGHWWTHGDEQIPLIITFHPAYLLRSPLDKAKAYQDLMDIRRRLSDFSSYL